MRPSTALRLARPTAAAERARVRLIAGSTASAGALLLAAAHILRLPDDFGSAPWPGSGLARYVTESGLRPGVVIATLLLVVPVLALTVQALRTRYPQGAEKQLIQAITGREVPPGKLPADVGCCVFNAATTAAIYDAVALGQPVYQRVITITGSAVQDPVNLLAPVGTPFSHLIEEAGGFKGTPARVISGGPMMGFAQYDMSVSMGKASNCILCLSKEDLPATDPNPTCIRCARCVNVCPMHLMPVFMNMYSKERRWSEVEDYRIMDCMECGSCQYICPARIPLVQQFRTAKFAIRQAAAKK